MQAAAASSLVKVFEQRVALRAAVRKHPKDLAHVSSAQLDAERGARVWYGPAAALATGPRPRRRTRSAPRTIRSSPRCGVAATRPADDRRPRPRRRRDPRPRYAYVKNRLFGDRDPGEDLYDPDHEDFDEIYTDSADEICMLWLET